MVRSVNKSILYNYHCTKSLDLSITSSPYTHFRQINCSYFKYYTSYSTVSYNQCIYCVLGNVSVAILSVLIVLLFLLASLLGWKLWKLREPLTSKSITN
jgi:hypothetical protein